MTVLNPLVKKFFEEYEKNIQDGGPQFVTSQYGDPLMVAMPKGAYSFKNEDFLKMLPNRKQFFDKTGLKASHIVSLEEIMADHNYFFIKTVWNFRFEKDSSKSFDVQVPSTYILRKGGESLRIIFQLDHEDLMEKIKSLGFVS